MLFQSPQNIATVIRAKSQDAFLCTVASDPRNTGPVQFGEQVFLYEAGCRGIKGYLSGTTAIGISLVVFPFTVIMMG
jgi:hypothetical protein